ARLSAVNRPFALLEWEVPSGIEVTHVSGPDVRSWSRAGSRLQIWLQRSVTATSLELSGWLPRGAEKEANSFQLPDLFFANAAPQWTLLKVVAGTGLTLKPGELQHLWRVPMMGRSSRAHFYLSREASYGGVFHRVSAAPAADVHLLTVIEP